MDSYSAFKISGSVVVWSPNKVGAFVSPSTSEGGAEGFSWFLLHLRKRCACAPYRGGNRTRFFFLGNVVHVLLWFFSSVLQNNTLTFKHITCFQLHNASKLFSASFVAVPFSQYCCGGSLEPEWKRFYPWCAEKHISVVSHLRQVFIHFTDTNGTVTRLRLVVFFPCKTAMTTSGHFADTHGLAGYETNLANSQNAVA